MRKLVVLAGLLISAAFAYGSPVSLVFVAFTNGAWQQGYPYYATVNGGPSVAVMCDDWEHGGLPGDAWQANFTNLGTNNTSLLRFNQMNGALTLYDEAGWLLLQTAVTSQAQWTDINFAVWKIFDSSVPLSANAQLWLDNAQMEAQKGFPGVDFYRVGIYTPVNQYDPNTDHPQEFLQIVPEPGTLILLGSGIWGMAIRRRVVSLRRRR